MRMFTTKDGRKVSIRPINTNDAALLVDMFHRSSEHTRQMRFHCGSGKCPEELVWREAAKLSHLDPERQAALVAVTQDGDDEQLVAVARFGRSTPNDIQAEAGIIVRDDFQGGGLGSHLLFRLAQLAQTMGIRQFSAWVLPENRRLLHIVNKIGQPITQELKWGEIHLVISLEKTEQLEAIHSVA